MLRSDNPSRLDSGLVAKDMLINKSKLNKLPVQDLRVIAHFFKIIKNSLKMDRLLEGQNNDYLFDDGKPDRPWLKCKSEMFDEFKKAMEE